MKRPVLASAVVTVVSLGGGMIAGFAIAAIVNGLPFHAAQQLAGIPALAGVLGGGALWGFLLARIHNIPNRRRASIVGSLSFGLGMIGAVLLLAALERVLVEQQRIPGLPVHVIFTLLFVPVTFLVATLGGSAILLVRGDRTHWFRSALATGLAASLSFLIVDLVLDILGMRVGAPGAEERVTMLTVAFLGSAAAALSGGAVLGRVLSKREGRTPQAAEHGG